MQANPNPGSVQKDEIYAITGAGGFIGNRLAHHLLDGGHAVIAIVRNADQAKSLAARGADVRIADIQDAGQITEAVKGSTGVFHLAALFNNPDCTWEDYRAVNVQGTINVLEAARLAGVRRVVHCSTVGVATEAEPPPYSEETPYSPQPDDKYEVTKCEAEKAALEYASSNGISLAVIRPAQVYGPGDTSKAKFYKLVKKGIIVNPGKTRKHLIHIDDLCRSFELAMTSSSADGQIFLIAGESSVALTELITLVAKNLGVPEPRIRLPAWPVTFACGAVETISNAIGIKPVIFRRSMDFFTRTVECNTAKAKTVLNFESQVSVADGVQETAAWYIKEGVI